ncbi:MAG: hypothetical protein AB7K09_05480 [Planctomycetota bacterium]
MKTPTTTRRLPVVVATACAVALLVPLVFVPIGCGSAGKLTAGQVRKYCESTHGSSPGTAGRDAGHSSDAAPPSGNNTNGK